MSVPAPSRLERAVDGLARAISPAWAARRELARVELAKLVGYREAIQSRLDRQVWAQGASADWRLELGYDRRNLVDRARQLECDNLLAGSLLDRSTEHVIGDGFQLRCDTADAGWNAEAQAMWEEWAAKEADSRGEMTFQEMLALCYRSYMRDGDVAVLLEHDGCLRIVESDEIAAPEGGYYRTTQADGVELDRRGKPIAFHVNEPDATIYPNRRVAVNRLRRIPASDVVFLARRFRAGQTRGLTAFLGTFWIMEQLDGVIEAVTTAERMAASLALFVQKKSPFTGATLLTDGTGVQRPGINLEPGSVWRLEPDETVQQIQGNQPVAQFEAHAKFMVRICGSRFHLTINHVILDYGEQNLSNTRAADAQVRTGTKLKQRRMGRFAASFVEWKFLNWIRERRLKARLDAFKFHWSMPEREDPDPGDALQADLLAIDAGLGTWEGALAKRGLTWEDVQEQQAKERKKRKALGLPDTRGTLTREPMEQKKPTEARGPVPKKDEKNRGEEDDLERELVTMDAREANELRLLRRVPANGKNGKH